jgi:hypothetical protein
MIDVAPNKEKEKDWRLEHLKNMRSNSLNVLLQQSIHGMERYKQRPLSQNSIREALKLAPNGDGGRPDLSPVHSDLPPLASDQEVTLEHEGTSLLFYYLFEDYAAAGPLKAAGRILEEMVRILPTQSSRIPRQSAFANCHILYRHPRFSRARYVCSCSLILLNPSSHPLLQPL